MPAPATPRCKYRINTKSSTIFTQQAKIRKYKGVLLSPSARTALDKRLNKMVAGIPKKIITKYAVASSIISAGVCKSSNKGRVSNTEKTVVIIATALLIRILAAKLFLTASSLFAPNFWEVIIESPEVRP